MKNKLPRNFSALLAVVALASVSVLAINKSSKINSEKSDLVEIDRSRDSEGDTFSIVAYDSNTGEIGGAGCSCYSGEIDFLNDIIRANDGTLLGAIHSQAAYNATNQANARARMRNGDTPAQIINWLQNNDVNTGGSIANRQYGIVGIDGAGTVRTAGFTGNSNGNYANDLQASDDGFYFSVQGNILDTQNGQDLLEDMRAAFENANGTLAHKLMAALQGAKRVGGDNRCQGEGISGRASFIRVLRPQDALNNPYIDISVYPNIAQVEPIDVLQCSYDAAVSTPLCRETINTFPYIMDFETKSWEEEQTCSTNSSWIRSRFPTLSSNTGPNGANEGTLYAYVEASDINNQGFENRVVMGSPCFEIPLNHTATMSFDYHMFGANMGTLKVTANDGTGWVELWSESGNKGASWFNDTTIDLSQFAGGTVKLRFDATTGAGFASDMAVDDVNITVTEIPCTIATQYNSGGWTNGLPIATRPAIINENYNTTIANIEACTLTVNTEKTLTISSGTHILIDGDITIDGTLVIEDGGSLVQLDDSATVINNGTISVQKGITDIGNRGFFIGASMMTTENKDAFGAPIQFRNHVTGNFIPHPEVEDNYPGASNFADNDGNNWLHYAGTMNPGEGYLVMPQTTPTIGGPADYTFNFEQTSAEGTLNNGEVTFDILYNGTQNASPNILGNPYASAIDAEIFMGVNDEIEVVYLWNHLTGPSNTYNGYNANNYSMGDISLYNDVLKMGLPAANGGATPNKYIASGQGFGVKAVSGTDVVFNNSMRVVDNNDTFNRDEEIRDRLWINIFNDTYHIGSTTGVAFTNVTTDQFDQGADISRLATPVSLYSELSTGEELGIQGRKLFEFSDSVSLGFSTQVEENVTYRVSLHDFNGQNLENADIILIDNLNSTQTLLNETDYEFTSNAGTFSNRFTVIFRDQTILNTNETNLDTVRVYPNPTQNEVHIVAPNTVVTSVELYDIQGRKVSEKKYHVQNNNTIDLSNLTTAMYFIKITTESGSTTKKVMKL